MQVIQAILKDEADDTQVALLYANQTPDDILLHAELQQLARDPRLKVWYTGENGRVMPLLYSSLMCIIEPHPPPHENPFIFLHA